MTEPSFVQALLAPLGDDPLVLVDVGARGGLPRHWLPLRDHLYWVAFEPDARSREMLDAEPALPPRHLVLPDALAAQAGASTLHLTRDEGDSSLLPPNRAFVDRFPSAERFDVTATAALATRRLDDVLAEHGVPRTDVIKLDTQGTEHDILEGAVATLRTGVLGVEVEVEFNALYQGQRLFADVDTLLRDAGLMLVDLAPRRWPYAAGADLVRARGPLVWGDALYLRPGAAVAASLDHLATPQRSATAARAALIALVHGLPDVALEVLDQCRIALGDPVFQALGDGVRAWDATSEEPVVPFEIGLKPSQLRALQEIGRRTGLKPSAQVRRALRQWIKDEH